MEIHFSAILRVLYGEDTLVLEVDVRPANCDIGYAEALLSTYASGWAHKTVQAIKSSGTDNALFLLDDDCVLRIPIRPSAVELLTKELVWLPSFAGLPLEVPKVLFHSQTKSQLGFDFGILTWLEGSVASEDRIDDPIAAAGALGSFLCKLHQKPIKNAPHAGPGNNNRGIDLAELTEKTLSSIEVLADEIHADEARDLWQHACSMPFRGRPVWTHGDLKADNMLAQDGQLAAVIDWGLSAVGDPAVDIAAAWTWVSPEARAVFQSASGADDASWKRAQGWALYCATIALSFFRGRSHEVLCNQSRRTLQMLGLRRS
ncbi:aminoglycoside phosphotransferase family protein [Rhodophyticola porphyridii]|uniref:Aminoglycoside phosphotransferase family protein n=1 Tax=Rhodophyticola porphyridii TaxID=1852017 RepID=A0A3L9Y6Y1_9RHOB|nr:aminoglycoside phosphotransferase family protein [Rhodophyticola porphyridii]